MMFTETLQALVRSDVAPILPPDLNRLAAAVVYHRLGPLIVHRWSNRPANLTPLLELLRSDAVARAAYDMRQTHALSQISDLLDDDYLLLKGAAFGPLLYGHSELRPRADIDLWFRDWPSVNRASDRLADQGWLKPHQLPGELVRHAIAMRRGRGEHAVHVDLHARCSRRHRVASALAYDDVMTRAIELTIADRSFHTLAQPDAFLHAALHLEAHHAGQIPPFVMVEDLRRLACRIDDDGWDAIWSAVQRYDLISALDHALQVLEGWSTDAVPRYFTDRVRESEADRSARFQTLLGGVLDDLQMLGGIDAAEYIRELAFPPADYLREHYGVALERPAPVLWAHRTVTGIVKLLDDRVQFTPSR